MEKRASETIAFHIVWLCLETMQHFIRPRETNPVKSKSYVGKVWSGRRPGAAVRHYNRAWPMTSGLPIESGARS